MSPTSLENDMVCLIDSLNFFEDDEQQQQALEHLADMCLQDGGAELFHRTKGLTLVFKLVLNRKTSSQLLQKAMFTLGNASLINVENKRILCSEKMLHFIQSTLLDNSQNLKMIASTSYFLACLCTNDERAQNNVRKLKCLDKLVDLYRFYHPKGNVNNLDVEQWFERPQSSSVIVLNHISHALKSIINKPKNVENQLICSRLLSLAVSTLSSSSTIPTKIDALQFISDCLHENEKTQQIFNMIGGIRCLLQCLKGESARNETQGEFLSVLLDTLSITTFGNSDCKKSAGDFGMIESLLDCLSGNHPNEIVLKSLICLSELVHECEDCQQKLLKADGIRVLIEVMSNKQDELTSKIGTTILQNCVKNLSDVYNHDSTEDEKGETKPAALSNLLQFITGNTKGRKEKRPQDKALKILLRSLKMSGIDRESSEKIKQLIHRIEDDNLAVKKIKKTNVRRSEVTKDKDDVKQVEEDMVALLKEQKEFLQQFKNDINNLRSEIASQVSECGDSISVRLLNNHSFPLTPSKGNMSSVSNFATTPSGIPRPKFQSLGSVPMKQKQLPLIFPSFSTNQHVCSTPPTNNQEPNSIPISESESFGKLKVVQTRDSTTVNRQNGERRRKDDNVSIHTDSWMEVDHLVIQNDERPALNANESDVLPLIYENVSCHDQTRPYNRIKSNRIDARSPTAFEKVERWRQSLNQQNPNEGEHTFKVPIMTPLMKRRRLSSKLRNATGSMELYTPSLDEKHYDKIVQNAPMKVLLSKRRRPYNYQDCELTPEQHYSDHWDRTKRTLTFDSYTSKLKRDQAAENDPENENRHQRICSVSSSRYFNSNSQKDFQEIYDDAQSLKHSEVCNVIQRKCIGCNPFSRLTHLNSNSHNLKSLIRGDRYTCHFHLMLFSEQFLSQDMTASRKSLNFPKNVERTSTYRQRKTHDRKWDSISVFSFRSGHTFEDTASIFSGCTANTLKRRRRQDYSKEEIQNILEGVTRYGTRWTAILNTYPFKHGRTAEDLRSKYKKLRKQIHPSTVSQIGGV